jgi:hypothetical protein
LSGGVDSAAVRGNEQVNVVVNRNGSVYDATWTGSNWTDYKLVGAQPNAGAPPVGYKGDPTIASWAPGRLDVFVRGGDDKLWQSFSTDGGSTWSAWLQPVGVDGTLASSPDVSSRGPNRLDVFVLGTDGAIYQRFWDGTQWNGAWLNQGVPAASVHDNSEPASVSRDGVHVDVFVRSIDNKLWQKSWDGFAWSNWFQPVGRDGTLASSPDVASWDNDTIVVFTIGTDGHMYALPFGTGGWGTWIRLAGGNDVFPVDQGSPGADARGSGRFDVFGRGTDNRLYQIWQ